MPGFTSDVAVLVAELNSLSTVDLAAWLEIALSGGEWRLPLDREETVDSGILRLKKFLNGDTRSGFREASLILLSKWNANQDQELATWPTEKVDALLSIVTEFASSPQIEQNSLAAFAVLWQLINDQDRFDSLPTILQNRILNCLEERSELFPISEWASLTVRDAARFGPTVFGGLIRRNLQIALGVLPELPATASVAESLALRVRWLIGWITPGARSESLRQISEALVQSNSLIRNRLQTAFAQAGVELSQSLEYRFANVLTALQVEPAPRDALNPFEVAA